MTDKQDKFVVKFDTMPIIVVEAKTAFEAIGKVLAILSYDVRSSPLKFDFAQDLESYRGSEASEMDPYEVLSLLDINK